MPSFNPTYKESPPIIKQVAQTIEQHAMFAPGDKVLVGVSGGPDSVALVHILNTLAGAQQIELAVAHLNHGLRPQADQLETAYVKQLAGQLNLEFHHKNANLDPGESSLEERARDVRYQFYNSLAKKHGYTKIALGHQADDDAEAVLLHLIRGSGLRGLSGIPPVRDHRIVRPLINVHREQIVTYLKTGGIRYMEDTSNTDLRFDRNRVRHQLLPLLEERFNPNIAATLHRMAGLCRDEDHWLESHLQPLQEKITDFQPDCLTLDLDLFIEQHVAVKRRLIRSTLRQWRGHLKRISAQHVEAIIHLTSPDRKDGQINLPGGLAAQRSLNTLRFFLLDDSRRFPGTATASFHHTITSVQMLPAKIEIPQADTTITMTIAPPPPPALYKGSDNHIAWFDLDRLVFPLHVRNVAPGDRFAPLGLSGTQKLKQLFIDRKIERARRHRIPILANDETIYWVAGVRRSNAALIDQATTQALCVTCQGPGP